MQKLWNVKKYDENEVKSISERFNISDILSKFLISKDIEIDDIDMYLNGDISSLRDPYEIKDMDKLVSKVLESVEKKEKICIYGDYDVDGITSITIMYKFLQSIGADVEYYLPDRLVEGYGINNEAIDIIAKNNVKLIISVDCGITAIEEVEYAKSLGITMCITDHHECSDELPNAYAIVNPKQKDDLSKFKLHAGVGVAFKCIMAISKKLGLSEESYLKYLDIVAIGTISDIVALLDENRIISKYGIKKISETNNVGLKALLDIIRFKEVDSTMVSFGIAPRINACGRMGHEKDALQLFLTENIVEATSISKKLNEYNRQRQDTEKRIFDEVLLKIERDEKDKPCIVLADENWHHGVIGIVSSKVTEMYYKPSILICFEGQEGKGSGRSVPGFDLHEALTKCDKNVDRFGGHAMAIGISVNKNNFNNFIYNTAHNLPGWKEHSVHPAVFLSLLKSLPAFLLHAFCDNPFHRLRLIPLPYRLFRFPHSQSCVPKRERSGIWNPAPEIRTGSFPWII